MDKHLNNAVLWTKIPSRSSWSQLETSLVPMIWHESTHTAGTGDVLRFFSETGAGKHVPRCLDLFQRRRFLQQILGGSSTSWWVSSCRLFSKPWMILPFLLHSLSKSALVMFTLTWFLLRLTTAAALQHALVCTASLPMFAFHQNGCFGIRVTAFPTLFLFTQVYTHLSIRSFCRRECGGAIYSWPQNHDYRPRFCMTRSQIGSNSSTPQDNSNLLTGFTFLKFFLLMTS